MTAMQRLRPVDHCRRVHAVGHIANIEMRDRVPCWPTGSEGTAAIHTVPDANLCRREAKVNLRHPLGKQDSGHERRLTSGR